MTDPKIRVSADVSGVESELKKIQAAAERINKALSDGFDATSAKSELAALEKTSQSLARILERVAKSGDDVSDIDFATVSTTLENASSAATTLDKALASIGQSSGMSQAVRNTKAVADNIQRAAKAQEALARDGIRISRQQADEAKRQFDHWRQSGARGTSRIRGQEFDDWVSGGWRSFSMDEGEARRHRDSVLDSVGVRGGAGAGGARGGRSPWAAGLGRRAGPAGAAIGGVLGSMTGGGDGGMWGGVGGAAGSGLGGLAGFLMGGPMGAMIGAAFGSSALGGIGRALDGGMQRAGEEGGTLTDLRHALGATKIDFEELRASVRHFNEGLGLSYNEAAKLAQQFGHTAGQVENLNVGREVGSAVGFGRGFGISPEIAVQFFAAMRHMGVTSSDRDNRKLALQIGEAVARGGTSAKMDEVLSSIQGFVQNSSRASLTQANAEAYASFMSSLTGLSMYGMKGDPGAAASAMGAADAAMRQGGAFGEASKNFSLGLYQRVLPGFTALDQDYLNEQGAFGTIGRAFGKDSAAYRFAQSRGDSAKMSQYDDWVSKGGNRSIMSMQMEALEKQFGGSTDDFRKAIQSHFGVGAGQASALYQAYQNDASLGGLEKSLSRSGVDISKLNTKQIAAMAELANSDDSAIRRQATRLMGLKGADALNNRESGDLKAALSGNDPEKLRKLVLGLTATHDTTRDQGDLMRKQQADMSNAMQKLATELIPLTMTIKDGIIELVKWAAPESEFIKKQEDAAAKQRADESRAATLTGGMADLKRQIDTFKEASPEENAKNLVALHQLKQQREAAAERGDKKGVAAYDANIASLEKAIRSGSAEGKQDLIDRYNSMAAERNSLTNVPGDSVAPMEGGSAAPASSGGSGGGKGPRNARNNNPGNIEYGDFARRHGATGSDGRFAIFPSKEAGSAAMDALLQNYSRRGLKSVRQIVGKWAPSSENDSNGYAEQVAKRLGVSPDEQLNLDDPKVAAALAREMARVEGDAKAYTPNERVRREEAARKHNMQLTPDGDKVSMDRKAPAAPGLAMAGGAGRQTIDINNRVTVYDQNGNERGDSVVQTRVGAPVPQGMMA